MNDAITIDNVLEPLRLYLSVMEQRITDLEGASPCSPASPAPSDGAAASSAPSCAVGAATTGSTAPAPRATTAASTTGCTASASHASVGEPIGNGRGGADPSAAIRADPAKQYGRCPICGDWGANRERRINGNDQCPKGHSYPSSTAVYHVPPPQPEKVTPAAASAWDEFWAAHGVDDAKDREAMHYGDFNRFVAAREKAAVEAMEAELDEALAKVEDMKAALRQNDAMKPLMEQHRQFLAQGHEAHQLAMKAIENAAAPKPDAGRAEGVRCPGCGKVAHPTAKHGQFFCSDAECPRRWLSFEPIPAPKPRRAPEVVARELWKHASYYVDSVPLPKRVLEEISIAAVRADRGEV